jgi:hypothetical protein
MLPKHDHDMTGAGGKQELVCGGLSTSDVVCQSSPLPCQKLLLLEKKKKNEKKILIPSAPVRLFYARIVILKRACVS